MADIKGKLNTTSLNKIEGMLINSKKELVNKK